MLQEAGVGGLVYGSVEAAWGAVGGLEALLHLELGVGVSGGGEGR